MRARTSAFNADRAAFRSGLAHSCQHDGHAMNPPTGSTATHPFRQTPQRNGHASASMSSARKMARSIIDASIVKPPINRWCATTLRPHGAPRQTLQRRNLLRRNDSHA
jgi:hypothetical protein